MCVVFGRLCGERDHQSAVSQLLQRMLRQAHYRRLPPRAAVACKVLLERDPIPFDSQKCACRPQKDVRTAPIRVVNPHRRASLLQQRQLRFVGETKPDRPGKENWQM